MSVIKVASRYTCREDTDEKWNEYARNGIATYVIVHTRETGDSGKQSVIMSSAEPFDESGVKEMVESTREKA